MKKFERTLYLVADTEFAAGKDLLCLIREAVLGGVSIVQLRAKTLGTRNFLGLASRIGEQLGELGVPLLINDRADIALACGAAGVHLGQEDLPLADARRLLGPDKTIGISVNTLEEAVEAQALGADYIGLGPIYRTPTKKTTLPILGLEGIRQMRNRIRLPILGIGGIHAKNAGAVMEAGADGIAVVSAILGARNPRQAAVALKKILG